MGLLTFLLIERTVPIGKCLLQLQIACDLCGFVLIKWFIPFLDKSLRHVYKND